MNPSIIFKGILFRIAWDSRQLTNSHCVDHFLLKFWESSSFSPKYTKLKFSLTDGQTQFGGKMNVIACKSYTYILSAVRGGGKVQDTQGLHFFIEFF
jgi:hypothetical protein